jgi:chemotaxis protein CheC
MLDAGQCEKLEILFQQGAGEASLALSQWLAHPASVRLHRIQPRSLQEATESLGTDDQVIGMCIMQVARGLSGQWILAFEDGAGLLLADLLLGRPSRDDDKGSWGDIERSAAMETANILACSFLCALEKHLPDGTANREARSEDAWLPSPPIFVRDYAPALMQFLLSHQAIESSEVLVAQTQMVIEDRQVHWHWLWIPDSAGLQVATDLLRETP